MRSAQQVFGVAMVLEACDMPMLEMMLALLPPSRRSVEQVSDELPAYAIADDAGHYTLTGSGDQLAIGDLPMILDNLELHVRNLIARGSPDHVFIHAGAAAWQGLAIIAPGPSFSGKTTLISALVRAGATYYSDEYAVIDGDGLVHPYPKPLAIRLTDGPAQTNHDVSELGGVAGAEPVPIGLVVAAQFRPDGAWQPTVLSAAETVLEIFGHTYQAIDRPQQTLAVLRRATHSAVGLRGERGEADGVAADLMARVAAA